MRTIYKYEFERADEITIKVPEGSELLKVMNAGSNMGAYDKYTVWFLVDPDARVSEVRRFKIFGTGESIKDEDSLEYVDTIQDRQYIWHIFEVKE